MPVLTCPFKAIPSTVIGPIAKTTTKVLIPTELSIKPTATESWNVEGLSLQFTTQYRAFSWANISRSRKLLIEQKTALEAQLKFTEEQLPRLAAQQKATEEQIPRLEQVRVFAEEGVASGGSGEQEKRNYNIQVQEAKSSVLATKASVESIRRETLATQMGVEVLKREILANEKEIIELGRQYVREAMANAPLAIVAYMYARSNELVWNSTLVPSRAFKVINYSLGAEGENSLVLQGEWTETLDDHIQFQEPINFTERENLRLVLELIIPPKVEEKEGGSEGVEIGPVPSPTISAISAIVNYSRTVAGEGER